MQEYIFALVLHAYSSSKEELAYIRFGEEITNALIHADRFSKEAEFVFAWTNK